MADQYKLVQKILAGDETINELLSSADQVKMMTHWLEETQRLNQLSLLIGSDHPTTPVNCAFCCGHVGSDIDGVLEELAKIQLSGMCKFIVLNGTPYGENMQGVPAAHGLIEMTERLGYLSVSPHFINNFGMAYHTGEESVLALKYAMAHNYHRCVVVGVPHRQLRFTSGMVDAMGKVGYNLSIYHVSPGSVDWQGETGGSQNANPGRRWDKIWLDEYSKILANAHGNLATPRQMEEYFENRK